MDKEYFFIFALKHEDLILGAPWFDCMATTMKFAKRKAYFTNRAKDMLLNVDSACSTIHVVHTQAFNKVIKNSLSCYMVSVKENSDDTCALKNASYESQEEIDMPNFLKEFQDLFTDDIPTELPPTRGIFDHTIELLPRSSPPNKPPSRVS